VWQAGATAARRGDGDAGDAHTDGDSGTHRGKGSDMTHALSKENAGAGAAAAAATDAMAT
jgi:hypothetical protein